MSVASPRSAKLKLLRLWQHQPLYARFRVSWEASLTASLALHVLGCLFLQVILNTSRETVYNIQLRPSPPSAARFNKREPVFHKPMVLRKVPPPKRSKPLHKPALQRVRMEPKGMASSWESLPLHTHPTLGLTDLPQQASELAGATLPLEVSALQPPSAITRTTSSKADFALDLLDIESMDIGRYRAMVLQDPADVQALKGFIKFAHVIPGRQSGNQVSLNQILSQIESLCDALNEYTGLQAEFLGSISYDDPRLLEVPIVAFPQFPLTQTETENLVRYLLGGGFIIYDFHGLPPELAQGLEKYGGLVNGRDFWTEGLPSSSPIFRAFFDFRGSFPGTSYSLNFNGARGLYVNNRLAAIGQLGDWLGKSDDNTRRLMFAINVVVFSLTQEGSITQRIMKNAVVPF